MIFWFVIQILAYLYSKASASQEIVGTWYFRENGSPDYINKLKIFHNSGFWMTLIFSIVGGLSQPLIWILPGVLVTGLWYFITFTIKYNKGINRKWDFIGTTSSEDIWIRKHFGEKGMRNLIYISGITILILNFLRIFFI